MSIDERLQAIAMHLELLSHMHEDLERKHEELRKNHDDFIRQMTAYAADVRDAVMRLTNIAEAHSIRLDDHERRIDDLEK